MVIGYWKAEIEKKYIIADRNRFDSFRLKAGDCGLKQLFYSLQRDWVPDFEDSEMKKAGILLRVRHSTYKEGNGPEWIITLKIKKVDNGIHDNLELEASSEKLEKLGLLENELEEKFHKKIDLKKIASLDFDYANSVGLKTHRMLLEKYRREFTDDNNQILLAFDELPAPLGLFIELEVKEKQLLTHWEKSLGLEDIAVSGQDYGAMVKNLDGGKQRVLTFGPPPGNPAL